MATSLVANNGQAADYYAQFYQPYEHYVAPIVAIPGNHDGWEIAPETSLEAFKRNFCAPVSGWHSPDAQDDPRTAMIQPNVFWTLITPLVNIIGLYSNVPEHGVIHPDQQRWLTSELASLSKEIPIIVTMQHPVYSADDHHSGSQTMHDALAKATQASGRTPDMVLAGHVHNYQRFTRVVASASTQSEVPYVVAGAGGYHNLHRVALVNGERVVPPVTLTQDGDEVTLERYLDDRHGFLRLEVSQQDITGRYYAVPRPQESWSAGATLIETFRLDLKKRKVF
jgi:3',5'-cyclic AMP phosphodiesterase CpdA